MTEEMLFYTIDDAGNQHWISNIDILEALREIKADQCDILFVHTDLSAIGTPSPHLRRSALLENIYQVLLEIKVSTIIFPAFTFSFVNGEEFNVNTSTAKYMGALNEYVRKKEGVVRSLDPLMSVIAAGDHAEEFYRVGKRCMGENGIFDKLHQKKNVSFLFLGAIPTHCFTYAHYVEAVYGVPYRFEKWFEGQITDKDGNKYTDSYSVYAGCQGITPAAMIPFEREMCEHGWYRQKKVGKADIICFDEPDAYKAVWSALEKDICGFLTKRFTPEDLKHELKTPNGRVVMVP